MASIRETPEGTFQVLYRDPNNRQKSKTWKRKTDAVNFSNTVEADKLRGEFSDPKLARLTIGQLGAEWLASITLKPKTMASYTGHWNTWVKPHFEKTAVSKIDATTVRAFGKKITDAGRSPATRNGAIAVLRLILGYAVERKCIRINPAAKLKLSAPAPVEMHFLTEDEVKLLAKSIQAPIDANPKRYTRYGRATDLGLMVTFSAYSGMRAGEVYGLKVRNVDLTACRVTVMDNTVEVSGKLITGGSTKTNRVRSVKLPRFLIELLTSHVDGLAPDDLVFPAAGGGPMRHTNYRSVHFKKAVIAAGLDPAVRVHDLRHTCAAFLIQRGAHPKAIMEHLGHSSITVTLNTYGHLFPGWDDGIWDE